MALYPTPHINATPEDFAKTVLMPGDPLRAKFIAENFLDNARLVNNVRGVQGYTGTYKGVPVSVMASGMGMQKHIKVRDIVLGMGACTDSNYASNFRLNGTFAPIASYKLLKTCADEAERAGLCYHVGNLVSSDVFYGDFEGVSPSDTSSAKWAKMGVMAVEMEAAALYMNASRLGKNALAICTISDHLLTGEATSAEERQNSFTQMITLALETAIKL